MKTFFKVFFGILFSCAILALAAFGIAGGADFLFSIVSSNEASVNNASDEKKPVILLDPGHGGMDGGAVGIGGICEKDLNLDLAKKLAEKLTQEGITVILTRDTDTLLTYEGASSAKNGDLRARLKMAEESEDCLFISLHMNKFSDSSVKGITLYHSPNNPEGLKLAEAIMAKVKENLQPENKRPIKAADSSLYILHRITRPAVLVECGFLSNAYEAALLADDGYRDRLAELLKDAIVGYIVASSQ
ncbi:MAG: N-acetylmuramoyl-L-alanine amidase [Clostridia bacterium]|nr:N-acetylmuramoyl-L-alanine amidase [Clostridia bacterium]